jgi:hypothetical protein
MCRPPGEDAAREPDAHDAHVPYSYNDPSKDQSGAGPPFDFASVQPIGAANPPKLDPEPTQVVRQKPIGAETMAMKRAYWALPQVCGTVWANYMLVATQWPTATQPNAPENDGAPFPGTSAELNAPAEVYQLPGANIERDRNLATTMDTYYQTAPGGCMGCHHVTANTLGRDFVAFIATDAR